MSESKPVISTVLISMNRVHLLKKTIESYLSTISVPYELFIVDNMSSDGCRELIEETCRDNPRHTPVMLDTDHSAPEAMNLGMAMTSGPFIHISENDIEYLPGWDSALLKHFSNFPKLGEITPFKPYPKRLKKMEMLSCNDSTIYRTDKNVIATNIIRRELWDKGIRWKDLFIEDPEMRLPADGRFSADVQKLGYWVAWNDESLAINWGFNIDEMIGNLDYYIANSRSKPGLGIEGFRESIKWQGYDLIEKDGEFSVVKRKD